MFYGGFSRAVRKACEFFHDLWVKFLDEILAGTLTEPELLRPR
jgi:hypothetical protein